MCGAQLSLMEHETRLADHYGGKMHCGMETIREQYSEMKGFERLEEAIRIVDKEIERTKEKLKKDCENEIDQAEILKTQMIGELGEKIGTTIVKMEALGNEGKVEEAMELSKTIEEYKRKKRDLENDVRTVLNTPQVRLRVCDMCGAQLSLMEHETRLADHYGGKMHCGMETIREQYSEMKVISLFLKFHLGVE
ncbi:hypothetical protein WUBG_15251 [Wuchereria bancrofti]|uniref:Uncharacterized protein n=1 Tax=Wuchereria bancrofti TaxID=6293 RepID=J9EA25_WUCBA|nr:hypothetical protein WUBG_15251 [Wuchereria bancrofti]